MNYYEKQLNEGYNGKLNSLFKKWKASYPDENIEDKFCPDGLVVKYKDEDSGYDINQEWEKSKRKIMFIVKDCPDDYWGHDTRRLLVGYEDNEKSQDNAWKTRNLKGRTGFFKNIARLLYGLYYMTEENKGEEFNTQVHNIDNLVSAINEIPFAYIEAKKMAGTKTCSSTSLRKALDKDSGFLMDEINILKPNIIICCDNNGDIFNSLVKNYFNSVIPDEDCRWDYEFELEDGTKCGFYCKLYYYPEKGILLFNSYHPTRLGKAEWKICEKVLHPFRQFFHKYKTFDIIAK